MRPPARPVGALPPLQRRRGDHRARRRPLRRPHTRGRRKTAGGAGARSQDVGQPRADLEGDGALGDRGRRLEKRHVRQRRAEATRGAHRRRSARARPHPVPLPRRGADGRRRHRPRRRAARTARPGPAPLSGPLGRHFADLETVARSPVSVVLRGETGTGKEVIARAVHTLSRRPGDFVAMNCGALPDHLVESELFGHKKGAFSGATEDRPGLVRAAHQWTLFLDEIGDLPAPSQAAFLRVLQEREVVPVGATRPVRVDLRLVAATHRDLDALVAEGRFRADLWARIAGFTFTLPPLRQRREDLGMLIATLVHRITSGAAERVSFSSEAARALFHHAWPQNVRELEKCLGAAVVLARGERIELEHLPETVRAVPTAQAHSESTEGVDDRPLTVEEQRHRDELQELLAKHAGNISAVARALGKARMQVHRWIKRYRLQLDDYCRG
ncbi:MAG: sigma-54-dependent Fis family transcriptional regulator [Myxococcales bacterium]|nr:sigma-54-dependent Fis family transcriptional regulator [Myxococcales bacterium]